MLSLGGDEVQDSWCHAFLVVLLLDLLGRREMFIKRGGFSPTTRNSFKVYMTVLL